MSKLTPEGEKIIASLASKYSISVESAKLMLDAVARGGGSMAQFSVPEFGSGQWMRGGMIMVGDMFNNTLKANVDNLCNDLSRLLSQPGIFEPVAPPQTFQQQSQGGAGVSYQSSMQSGSWWPQELGNASSAGAQNNMRYAYFPGINRLAIDGGDGRIEVYDTTGYDIGGFGQQQGGGIGSLTFSSYRGTVRVADLPRVSGQSPEPVQSPSWQSPQPAQPSPAAPPSAGGDSSSVLALIEQLNQLKEKGILSEQEFAAKKAELLKRL